MNDVAWKELVPRLCKGIRAMPIICDHADWWFILTLDGFSSHLLPEVLHVFTIHKAQDMGCQRIGRHIRN